MMSIFNRAARVVVPMLFAAVLAACGDSEADQRSAFIKFLNEVNGRSGVHILNPTPDEEKAFGPYLQHYAVITDYAKDMNAAMLAFRDRIQRFGVGPGSLPRTVEQMAAAPQDLPAVKADLEKMEQALETRLAKAKADRAALKQPDDLKAVYDKTFDKLVAVPSTALITSEKVLDDGIDASIKLVDYISTHRNKLVVSGTSIEAKDQRTLNEIAPLLKAHQEAGERFVAAQRAGERLVEGQ
jgi:hypothetical protein